MATKFHLLSAALALAAACHPNVEADQARERSMAALEGRADKLHSIWLDRQLDAMTRRTSAIKTLGEARELVEDGQGAISVEDEKIPKARQRDFAVCLKARQLSDERLTDALDGAGDFSLGLSRWIKEQGGIELFCLYALNIGTPRE